MGDRPFFFDVSVPGGVPSSYDNRIVRRLSAMKGQYADEGSYEKILSQGDIVLYEVYEIHRPQKAGELLHGTSIVHPGKVGDEYFMTKGHFHDVLDTAEIYYCLQGRGMMVMESPEGEWSIGELQPGRVLYVPPRWAHRSVNTDDQEGLVTLFVYPGHAGHDYGTIEARGFRKRVVEREGQVQIVDNPGWGSEGR